MIRNSKEDWIGGQPSQPGNSVFSSMNASLIQGDGAGSSSYVSYPQEQVFRGYPEQTGPLTAFTRWSSREPLLASAVIASVVIMVYEVLVIVSRPMWAPIATDWVRASLGWAELLPVLLAAGILYRYRKPGMMSWIMFAIALLSYAIAQTTWAILDRIVEPNNVPVPSQADVFYLLQYPFFFLGLALLPGLLRQGRPSIARAKIVLDSVLLMAAGTALSWYFILAPFYLQSGQSLLGKATNMAYPVGDLGLLFGLTMVVISQRGRQAGQGALRIFIAAVACLIVADSIFLNQELYPSFNPGDLANGFWMASYLLFALAGLVRFRAAQRELGRADVDVMRWTNEVQSDARSGSSFQSFIPFLAAVLASAFIVFRAATAPASSVGDKNLLIPFLVGLGLLMLIGARQGITVLENERLLRNEQRRSEELDQAKQMAEKQRSLLAERNQRLQVDIEVLKEIHARVARGDYAARVPITSGELLPIAGSLNIMLDRLSKLIRASFEYERLEQAAQLLAAGAYGIAEGDDTPLRGLSMPTNTILDGIAIALRQIRARIKEMEASLQKLDQARTTAHELSSMVTDQARGVTDEGLALSRTAGTFNQMVADLERIGQQLRRIQGLSPVNRQVAQAIEALQGLSDRVRQQQAEIDAQVARFNQLASHANLVTSRSNRLVGELNNLGHYGGRRARQAIQASPGSVTHPSKGS